MPNIDVSSPVGIWYLNADGSRLSVTIAQSPTGYSGTWVDEASSSGGVSNIAWDGTGRWLEFRRDGQGFFQWYRLSLVHGVVSGRFSHGTAAAKPALTAYTFHVTGWSPSWLDGGIVPRTWTLTINTTYRAVLRIDRDASGALRGRFKVFDQTNVDGAQEELEHDLAAISWNGTSLGFTVNGAGFTQVYEGTVSGRSLTGTFQHDSGPATPWTGTRAEVLGFGLGSRLAIRDAWQETTRAAILNLTDGMHALASRSLPAVAVTEEPCIGCPFLSGYPPERDDDPDTWPPSYSMKRLKFSVLPGSRFDPAHPPPARVFHGYLATPNGAPPAGGFRAVVAVNGHNGSAKSLMTSSDPKFWYGESAARRDLVVLALDIGHRPSWSFPPVVHPPIVDAGYADSNWEEDGERSFSVRRAIDWLSVQPGIRADRIFMMGLSLGGEVTTITTGLDPRIAMGFVAGYSPDMNVMDNNYNHQCYKWTRGDIHEYLDASDFEALTAPRPLVVETGIQDDTFSPLATPWAADKQVTRRARAAYGGDAAKLIHYLHYDVHAFHVGGKKAVGAAAPVGVGMMAITEPSIPGDTSWQTDASTTQRSPSIYDLMNEFAG